jgi:hypothetical protein
MFRSIVVLPLASLMDDLEQLVAIVGAARPRDALRGARPVMGADRPEDALVVGIDDGSDDDLRLVAGIAGQAPLRKYEARSWQLLQNARATKRQRRLEADLAKVVEEKAAAETSRFPGSMDTHGIPGHFLL